MVWLDRRSDRSARSRQVVQGPGQFPVGRSRSLQLLCLLVDFALFGSDLLLKESDAALDLADVDGYAKASIRPSRHRQLGGQAALQPSAPCRKTLDAFQRVREVGCSEARLTAAIRLPSTMRRVDPWCPAP
ncbi:hypothetical protein [Streptomyces sp. NPDC058441]|uniref:hypothetical protein n=1 Tax=Streptomyces sp. NPDC058441 TaxID=3346502 RepID=UPI003656AAFD